MTEEQRKKRAARTRRWRHNHPEKMKEYYRKHYLQKKAKKAKIDYEFVTQRYVATTEAEALAVAGIRKGTIRREYKKYIVEWQAIAKKECKEREELK